MVAWFLQLKTSAAEIYQVSLQLSAVVEMQLLDSSDHWLRGVHITCVLKCDAGNDTSILTVMRPPFLHVFTAMQSWQAKLILQKLSYVSIHTSSQGVAQGRSMREGLELYLHHISGL